MPARVTYWVHSWDPAQEGISKEVAALRVGDRARAPVVAFSPGLRTRIDHEARVLTLSGRRSWTLRTVAALVEPRGDVTHVFGGHTSWHFLRALGRRPLVLTVVEPRDPDAALPRCNLGAIVVETESSLGDWTGTIAADRLHVVPPGVDLDWFAVGPPPIAPAGRFRLLFASTPADVADMEPRGIPLLVELARMRPDLEILMPWRDWGDVAAATGALRTLNPPPNVTIRHGTQPDMRPLFSAVHATITCFRPMAGKACPNFVVEGLAAGRPCVMTPGALSDVIERAGAGVVSARDVRALASAVDRLRASWPRASDNARRLAVEAFGLDVFRRRYEAIYEAIAPR